MTRLHHISCVVLTLLATLTLSLGVAAASPLCDLQTLSSIEPSSGVKLSTYTATANGTAQRLCAVTADADDWMFAIGGTVSGKTLVEDSSPIGADGDAVAAVNGDHFSFATGVPLGMSISGGRIVTGPVEAYDADEYYFHVLGITADGTVLTGENPLLHSQATVGGKTLTVERINRTRELWEGAQVCLYTPDYGDRTATDVTGVEFVIAVEEGEVSAGSTVVGTVQEINRDNDSVIADGTVVLSVSLMRYGDVEHVAVGDRVELSFSFEDEAWNEVLFAVGGNLTAVENGEPVLHDYDLSVFADPQPRSAIGVQKDGTLVMATVDGRSQESGGLTANQMAEYMAYDMACDYAILLDGGGSTALCAANDEGMLETVNVPSEERPVGNTVMLVAKPQAARKVPLWLWIVVGIVAANAVAGAVSSVVFRRKFQSK